MFASLPLVIPYPEIDPILIQIGPFAIRWYALAYISGLALGWAYIRRIVSKPALWWAEDGRPAVMSRENVDDLLFWATLGVLAGGRFGHVFFYGLYQNADHYLSNPLRIFYVWEGGMSFHGGLLGVILAIIIFCRRQKLDMLRVGDAVAIATPIGLCFGRIANFINGEIWGKPTDVWWAMVFPNDRSQLPRHPSQLYEAVLEGALLFAVLAILAERFNKLRRPGLIIGYFMIGYGIARLYVEIFFRDSNNKIQGTSLTIGEVLSAPMLIIGLLFIWNAYRDRFGPVPLVGGLGRLSTYSATAPKKGKKSKEADRK